MLETVQFVLSLEESEHTDLMLSLRPTIRDELSVQAFLCERTGSRYFALGQGRRWIYGLDREGVARHLQPFDASDEQASFGGTRPEIPSVDLSELAGSPAAARSLVEARDSGPRQ